MFFENQVWLRLKGHRHFDENGENQLLEVLVDGWPWDLQCFILETLKMKGGLGDGARREGGQLEMATSYGLICKGTWCLIYGVPRTVIVRLGLVVSLKQNFLEMLWEKVRISHFWVLLSFRRGRSSFLTFAEDITYK